MKHFFDFIKEKNLIWFLPTVLWMILLIVLNYFYSSNVINSDISAELILARELSRENKLITTDWYYSTEIRLVYTQLISLFLFKIFTSWKMIRTIMNLIFYVLMIISFFYCVKPLNLKRKAVYLSSSLLVIPFSMEYIYIVHIGNSYIPHFILLLFTLGLALRIIQKFDLKKMFFYLLLSFICGLCGIRYLTILALPLFFAAILDLLIEYSKEEKQIVSIKVFMSQARFYVAVSGFISCCLGYLINSTIFSKIFQFATYEILYFKDMSLANVYNNLLYCLSSIFTDTLTLFNFVNGVSVKTLYGMGNIAALMCLIIFCIIAYKVTRYYDVFNKEIRLIILFFIISLFVNIFIFTFVEGAYAARYNMFIILLMILLLAVFLSEEMFWKKLINKLMVFILLCSINFAGLESSYICANVDKNSGLKKACNFMVENDLTFGMATFWQAGVITELTDGKVDVVNVYEEYLPASYHWLLSKKSIRRETWENAEEEKVFILLTPDEVKNNSDKDILTEGELVYEDEYYIFIYDREFFIKKYGERIFLEE